MNRLSRLVPVLLVLMAGCAAGSDHAETFTIDDSAGVAAVADSGDDHDVTQPLRLSWTRGGINDDDVALMSAESGHIGLLGSGGVVFLDVANMTVRTLDAASGESRLTWGGQGSGPGELRFPSALAVVGGDTVAVFDRGRGRIIRWTSRGDLIDETPVRHFFSGNRLRRTADGFVFNTHRSTIRDESLQSLLLVNGDSARTIRTFTTVPYRIGTYPSCPNYGPSAPPLFSVELIWDASDSLIVIADSEDYVIDLVSLNGDVIHQISRNMEPPPLSEAIAAERFGEDWSFPQLGCTIPAREIVRARGFADRLPLVGGLLLTESGQLWVQRNSLESAPYLIDVFSQDGKYLGTMPKGTPFPAAISSRDLVSVGLDEDGVPVISLHRR